MSKPLLHRTNTFPNQSAKRKAQERWLSMLSFRILTSLTALQSSSSSRTTTATPRCSISSVAHSVSRQRPVATVAAATLKSPCNLEPVESEEHHVTLTQNDKKKTKGNVPGDRENDVGEEGISSIQVPRQKFIPVSKSELLDGIVSTIFDSQEDDTHQFLLLSSYLDSILHAEHKSILELMRADYYFSTQHTDEDEGTTDRGTQADFDEVAANEEKPEFFGDIFSETRIADGCGVEHDERYELPLPFNYGLDLRGLLDSSAYYLDLKGLLGSSDKNAEKYSNENTRLAVATRFQRAFLQLLNDAQFEELSARDLALTSALNTDYLLTLPIYVDWKRASESNAIIFRRGYATERQKGLLIVEKLDYIQSRLLRGIFTIASKPLGKLGKWVNEAFTKAYQTEEVQDWIKGMKIWPKELSLFRQLYLNNRQTSDNLIVSQLSDTYLPIRLAAQRAVSRYEGLLSPLGPRERLFRKLLAWIGLIHPAPETTFQLDSDFNVSEPYLRPIFLSRMTLSDIWRPATRKFCGNDFWKKLKTSISILLSPSTLQEPAFQELILLYTEDVGERDNKDKVGVQSLQIKIYERIPIPDLPVIFPHKKLSFRIIDTVRLDVATILGLLAYFINYKFENILSSPSAIFLDVVAISALIIYVSRVALGYKQTWDRYQLLVNKALYEKTLASGFGAVHFLLDASEQQQYKEAILTYAVLLKMESQVTCRQSVRDKCERFMYDVFKKKVEMPVDKAMDTLMRLGLVKEGFINGKIRPQPVPCSEAYTVLKERWNSLLG